jgi:hypothetical protein
MSHDIRNAGNASNSLLDPNSFCSAGEIDSHVPAEYGLYAIRLRVGAELPEPFGAIRRQRDTHLVYLGEAQRQTLRARLLGNELRAKGNGTFFRSLGAVLGFRPPAGSLAGRARQQNYRFAPSDRDQIVEWINEHLEVSWVVLRQNEVHAVEVQLIGEQTPLLNLKDNPLKLKSLSRMRDECRAIASTPATTS